MNCQRFGAGMIAIVLLAGLFLVGCEASINTKRLFTSSFSAQQPVNTQNISEMFESKAFRNTEGDILRYRLLRPIGANSSIRFPLVVVLGDQAVEHLQDDTFRTVYPAYVVVPEFSSAEDLIQLLLQLEAFLPLEEQGLYLLAEKGASRNALEIAAQLPRLFSAVALIDLPPWKLQNLDTISKANLMLFANTKKKKSLKMMYDLKESVINYGGHITAVEVDPAEGDIIEQVYDDPEFWRRIFRVSNTQ